ncbi:MAG: metal-dependent hydrolase, partial [Nitrosopumilaceae archaeon]
SFAIILDSDHLIQFLGIEAVIRMGHSIPFAIISAVAMLLIFGRKNYLLSAVAIAGVLVHVSFDTFSNAGKFPFFTPFYNGVLLFRSADWIFFELAAIVLVGLVSIQVKRASMKKENLIQ